MFDVVIGDKGNETANVTGPNGGNVKGSSYAPERRGRGRRFLNRRRRVSGQGAGERSVIYLPDPWRWN